MNQRVGAGQTRSRPSSVNTGFNFGSDVVDNPGISNGIGEYIRAMLCVSSCDLSREEDAKPGNRGVIFHDRNFHFTNAIIDARLKQQNTKSEHS